MFVQKNLDVQNIANAQILWQWTALFTMSCPIMLMYLLYMRPLKFLTLTQVKELNPFMYRIRTEYYEYFWTTVNIIHTWQEKQCRWKVSSPDLMTRAEAGIGWRQRAHWPPPNILRRETKGQRQQRLDRYCPFKRSGQGQGQRPVPAVVQQAVDIPIPAVERGVRLQIALALAASQAAVVPHPACCQ